MKALNPCICGSTNIVVYRMFDVVNVNCQDCKRTISKLGRNKSKRVISAWNNTKTLHEDKKT